MTDALSFITKQLKEKNILPVFILIFTACLILTVTPAVSAPYIPTSNHEVLIELKENTRFNKFKKIRVRLERNKLKPLEVVKILQETFEYGKKISNPRYIGFTLAYLNDYLDDAINVNPISDLTLLKANILQHDHQFGNAINLLNLIIKKDPVNPNARLMRASVLQAQAKYSQALNDCYSLIGSASHLITIACISQTKGIIKNTENSYTALLKTISINYKSDPGELSWAYDILAQLAMQQGDLVNAEKHMITGLKYSEKNMALLNSYADLLLNKNEYEKVLSILKTKNNDFTALLRLTIAETYKTTESDTPYRKQFLIKLNEMKLLSDTTHQREISAYYLYVENDINQAMKYAINNWAIQKELYDAELLLKCVLESKNILAAKDVFNWYENNTVSDIRIRSLINKINLLDTSKVRLEQATSALVGSTAINFTND